MRAMIAFRLDRQQPTLYRIKPAFSIGFERKQRIKNKFKITGLLA
jgi:hypothetical protein